MSRRARIQLKKAKKFDRAIFRCGGMATITDICASIRNPSCYYIKFDGGEMGVCYWPDGLVNPADNPHTVFQTPFDIVELR